MSRPGNPLSAPLKPPTSSPLPPLGPGDNAYITGYGTSAQAILTPAQASTYPPVEQMLMMPTRADQASFTGVPTPTPQLPASTPSLPPLGLGDNAYVTGFGTAEQAIVSPEDAASYPPAEQQLMIPTRVGAIEPPPDPVPGRPPGLRPLPEGTNAYISDYGVLTPEEAMQFPPEAWHNMMPVYANSKPPLPRPWYERWGEDIADSRIGGDINRLTDDTWKRGDGSFGDDLGALTDDLGTLTVDATLDAIPDGVKDGIRQVGDWAASAINRIGDFGGDLASLAAWLAEYAPYLITAAVVSGVLYASAPLLASSRRTRSE